MSNGGQYSFDLFDTGVPSIVRKHGGNPEPSKPAEPRSCALALGDYPRLVGRVCPKCGDVTVIRFCVEPGGAVVVQCRCRWVFRISCRNGVEGDDRDAIAPLPA